jgi:hypothetical protein
MACSHKTSFYVAVFSSLVFTLSYCLAVYLIWPSVGEYRKWKNYAVKKERLVRTIGETPKIILDGGSATLYGIRAKDVQRAFGLPTVNHALCAGFDLDYIFYKLKKVVKRGDVVILPLEYELFFYVGSTSSFKASYILSCDREYFLRTLNWRQKFEYVRLVMGFNDVFKAVKKSRSPRSNPWPLGMLNENGDITGNVGKHTLAGLCPVPFQQGKIEETQGLMLIKDFNRWAQESGITVYLSFANRVYSSDYKSEECVRYFDNLKRYLSQNNIAVIGNPYDFFFSEDLFYDTLYHLNETGVTLRTQSFIGMLADKNPELFKVRLQPPGSTTARQN